MSFEEQKIQEYISSNPEEKPIVLSELNLIIRQHDKTFNLPTIIQYGPEDLENIRKKILAITQFPETAYDEKMKKELDKVAKKYKIPFPPRTRKNKDCRLQWALIHWDDVEKYLLENFQNNSSSK